MAKRIADKELTDRNWDQEEEGEEAGTFCLASEDVLKSRPIKKAKRRNVGAEADVGGAFKGFRGFAFSASASTPPTATGFGNAEGCKGFGGVTNGSAPAFRGFSAFPASSAAAGVTFNGGSSSSKMPADSSPSQANGSAPGAAPSCSRNREYSRQLAALNRSVRDWISKHVDDNPLCDLNPIFRDYERHLASIERKFGGGRDNSEETPAPMEPAPPPSGSAAAPPSAALFSFSRESSADRRPTGASSDPAPAGITFNFGQKVDGSVLNSLGSKPLGPAFSFTPSSSSQTPLFGAASSTAPLPFGGTKAEETPPTDETGEAESEEPPKPEVKEVKEDDAFYSKKCKLFYKKDSEFKEKGVGTLHLKRTGEGKTQMIIRADTNLGNILLNVMVHASMPCTRVGKNNVMVVSVPNPPVDEKNPGAPVPLLIRVKTGEDADELHKTLEEKKG